MPSEAVAISSTVAVPALQRQLSWTGAFWIASGVPALVLFSIGQVGATVGRAAWLVWIISILLGFVQSFTYAEIAGLFPNKSGGASVYGAIAWVRYGRLFAPLSVWCNWLAWTPVLAIGSGLAAGYMLSILVPGGSALNTWQVTLLDLGWLRDGLSLRLNATFFLGGALLLVAFAIQHRGIGGAARAQMILGIAALAPLLLLGLLPLLEGRARLSNLLPVRPLAHAADGSMLTGAWNPSGLTLIAGGLFIAAWSTYGFETAVCYTREFRDPRRDTAKAILYSGLLCIFVFTILPMTFQGVLGLGRMITPAAHDAHGLLTSPPVYDGILAPDIGSGMGVARALAGMIQAGPAIQSLIVVMLVLALTLSIITSMAGSSRTLYQASHDGWLPRYLAHANGRGAPTRAMWTDLCFNLVLLMLSDYTFVLAISNVCYIVFNFMNLNAGWIHRLDRPDWTRPFRAPAWLLAAGAVLSFVNLVLLGVGADVWGAGTLLTGVTCAALIFPVFVFRHFIQDRGVFPPAMADDMHLGREARVRSRAGILPYLTLAAGVLVVLASHHLAVYR